MYLLNLQCNTPNSLSSLRTDVQTHICIRKFKLRPFIRDNSGHQRYQVVYIYWIASLPFYLSMPSLWLRHNMVLSKVLKINGVSPCGVRDYSISRCVVRIYGRLTMHFWCFAAWWNFWSIWFIFLHHITQFLRWNKDNCFGA